MTAILVGLLVFVLILGISLVLFDRMQVEETRAQIRRDNLKALAKLRLR